MAWLVFASEIVFIIIASLLALIAIYEYEQAVSAKGIHLNRKSLFISTTLLLLSFALSRAQELLFALIPFIAALGLILIETLRVEKTVKKGELLKWYLIPIVWIVLPFISLVMIRFNTLNLKGEWLLLFLVGIVTLNDTFAYFGGKTFGKHKLAPKISPKKTIEGSAFGYLGGICGGLLINWLFADFSVNWKLLLVILMVTLASQIGDLVESKFKRYCGVKDSSNLIPGHGGFLDRFDAFLLTLPVFWVLISLLGVPNAS